MADMINHPPHYTHGGPEFEHHKVVRAWGLNYWMGQCTKYICRHGRKSSAPEVVLEDLRKARWYLNAEIEYLEERIQRQGSENSNQNLGPQGAQTRVGDYRYKGEARQRCKAIHSSGGMWVNDPEPRAEQPLTFVTGRAGPPTPKPDTHIVPPHSVPIDELRARLGPVATVLGTGEG
jgi:Protein of unknwon function (DUF3310)